MNVKTRQIPQLATSATVVPSTFDRAARTVEVVWTTGAKGLRAGVFSDPYYEELEVSPEAVDLSRLKKGAPVLAVHDAYSLRGVIGVVEDAWLVGREGHARLRFSKRAEVDVIMDDVEDGILRNISCAYQVERYRRIRSNTEGEPDTLLATRWQPNELSFVPVGFDANAQTRAGQKLFNVVIESDEDATRVWVNDQRVDDEGGEGDTGADSSESDQGAAGDDMPDDESRAASSESDENEVSAKPGSQRTGSASPVRAVKEIRMDNPAAGAETHQRILQSADQFRAHCPNVDRLAGDALRAGKSYDDFIETVMGSISSAHTDMSRAHVGLNDTEVAQYSIARAAAALVTGDWSQAGLERAASEAVAKQFGRQANGFFVPMDAFRLKRDFTAGTPTEAGNLIATDLRADLFTDVLRPQLALAALGATMLPGLTSNIAIPKKVAAGTMGFVAETAAAAETAPVTGQITMTPHRISTKVEASKQALMQSALALEPLLRQDLLDGLSVEVEDASINGSGASNEPLGLRNTSGVGAVIGGTNGLLFNWTKLVGLETAPANANATNTARAGYLVNTKTRGAAKTIQKAANLPFIWDNGEYPLNGHRAAVSNLMPSNLVKGSSGAVCSSAAFSTDWSMLVVGFFGVVDITVDALSRADEGLVRLILNHFIDVGTRLPAAFAIQDDILTQ